MPFCVVKPMKKEYMSGCELRKYLHISTRKMKYLMDNDLIPHENTGQATHKYRVSREDARKFKQRMAHDSELIAELAGKFSSHSKRHKKTENRIILAPTKENSKAFRAYLTELWENYPEAILTQNAARLIGSTPQSLHKLIREGVLHGAVIMNRQYCSKNELIKYIGRPEVFGSTENKKLRKLTEEFVRVRDVNKSR